MKPILVLYATREGYTRQIAEHVGATLRSRGLEALIEDVRGIDEPFEVERYEAAILMASLHATKHEEEMVKFVKLHRAALERMPAAFISVSLTEALAEDTSAPSQKRAEAAAGVKQCIDTFFEETGWHPARVKPVAGALLYTEYGRVLRLFMRWVAKQAVGDGDDSSDHEYTDWAALDRFVAGLVAEIGAQKAA